MARGPIKQVGFDGFTDQQQITLGRDWETAVRRRTDRLETNTMSPHLEGSAPGEGACSRWQLKARIDGSDLLEAAYACFQQLYEYTSELSKTPHDSQEWGKLLGARDSAEF